MFFSYDNCTTKYEFKFKNYVKNKINLITNKITDNLINNIFNISENKYLEIVSTLEKNIRDSVLTILKETIVFFDDNFRESLERKKYYHINVRHDERTIKTILGDIFIVRTYYVHFTF